MDGSKTAGAPVETLARMRNAMEMQDSKQVLALLRGARVGRAVGAALHPQIYSMGINAAINLRHFAEARKLLEEARRHYPAKGQGWSRIAARLDKLPSAAAPVVAAKRSMRDITVAIGEGDWPTAFAHAAALRSTPSSDITQSLRIMALLRDWSGILNEEAMLVDRLGLPGVAHLPVRRGPGRVRGKRPPARRLGSADLRPRDPRRPGTAGGGRCAG
jgi:hypothetical protein